jgi:hypothetical protein
MEIVTVPKITEETDLTNHDSNQTHLHLSRQEKHIEHTGKRSVRPQLDLLKRRTIARAIP